MFLTPQSLRQYRLFAHDEWRIKPPLVLNAGAMLEDDGMGNRKISPRVAFNYHITPEHTLRTSASVAYRNPALMEERSNQRYMLPGISTGLYQMWFSYGGLRPERIFSREIGYLGNFANGFSVDMRVYTDQVSDIIYYENIPFSGSFKDPQGFRNTFSAHFTGLEGMFKYSWGQKSSLTFNYSHQRVSCELIGSPYLSASLPYMNILVNSYSKTVPLNSGSLLYIGQMSDSLSFSAGYYQQGTVTVLDVYDRPPQPLTRRTDIRMAKQFGSVGEGLQKIGGGEIALVVQNVFQYDNVGYSGYVFDRRAFVTATVNF